MTLAEAIRRASEGLSVDERLELMRSNDGRPQASTYRPSPLERGLNAVQDFAARHVGPDMARKYREGVDFVTMADSGPRAINNLIARRGQPLDWQKAGDILDAGTMALPLVGAPLARGAKGAYSAGRRALGALEEMRPRPAPRLSTTFEVQTGANTGQPMAPDMRVGRLDPMGLTGRREDALYRAAGYKSQGPARQGSGAYRNSLGEMEYNPVFVGDVELPGGLSLPANKADVESLEGLRALLTAQEAGAAHSIGEKGAENAILMQRGRLPRGEEMAGLSDMGDLPYMATPSSRGALAFPYDMGDTSRLDEVADKLAREMNLPGSRQRRVAADSVYVPGLAKGFDDDFGIVASEPFSGEATMGALERLAGARDQTTANLAGDRRLRSIIGDMIARDDKVPGARQDLQNTRRLFQDPRWNEAVQLIRLGAPPAAALARSPSPLATARRPRLRSW